MSLLIFAIIVLILLALGCWAVRALPIAQPYNNIVQVLIVLIGMVAIAQRAGLI